MIRIPVHRMIVPRTQELSFYIPVRNTDANLARNANVQHTIMSNDYILPLTFMPRAHAWIEVYIDGNRVINPRYVTANTAGIHYEEFNILSNNAIAFTGPVTGNVTVICDTEIEPRAEKLGKGIVIDIENTQSWNYYQKKFNPARWATGNVSNKFGGNVRAVNPYGLYNTEITYRVGDAIYAEPIVLKQPLNGYARITANRQNILYVPNKDFIGNDVFTYTLMTVHGQIGLPACVHIEVVEELPLWQLNASPNLTPEGGTITFTLTSTRPVADNIEVAYAITGTGITFADFGGDLLTGNFVTMNNSATVVYNVAEDELRETPIEKLTMTLVSFPKITANAYIQDTSPPPTTTTSTSTTTTTAAPRPSVVLSGPDGGCIKVATGLLETTFTATFDRDMNPWNFTWIYQGLNVMRITGGPRVWSIVVRRAFVSYPSSFTLKIPENAAYSKIGARGNTESNTITVPACL